MIKEFSYIVSLVAQNSEDGSLFKVAKEFQDTIELNEDDYYVPFALDSDAIDKVMTQELKKYANENNLNISNIEVITKEVATNDDIIDIYFVKNEQDNTVDIKPSINVEVIPSTYKPKTPSNFMGNEEEGVIVWQWGIVKDCAYKIINENDEVISVIGIGNRYYIESNVERGKEYTRRVIAFNDDGDSDPSDYVTVAVKPIVNDDNLSEDNTISSENNSLGYDSEIKEISNESYGRLSKFKSGIGDGKDLFIYKPDQTNIYERLSINTVVKALNNVEQRVYTPIDVEYFIKAVGEKILYGAPDSNYYLRLQPWPVHKCVVAVHSIITEPLTFEVECRLNTYYQKLRSRLVTVEVKGYEEFPKEIPMNKKIHITARDENGDLPDSDVVFSVNKEGCSIDSNGNLYCMMPGEITIMVYYKHYKTTYKRTVMVVDSALQIDYKEDDFEYSSKYSKSIVDGYRLAQKTIPYKKSYTINGIVKNEVLEDVEQYLRNCDNDILSSPNGTVQVVDYSIVYCSNGDVKVSVANNKIMATSDQNEKIYTYRKTLTSKIYIDQKSSMVILDAEKIIYRNKYNAIYTGNNLPTTSIDYIDVPLGVEIYDSKGDIKPEQIKDQWPSLYANVVSTFGNVELKGTTSSNQVVNTYNIHNILKEIKDSTIEEFILEVVELKINGKVDYATTTSEAIAIVDGAKYIHVANNPEEQLLIKGLPTETIVPFEEVSETIKCTVNGKTPYLADYDGKQNYVEYAPVFKFKDKTQNVEYEVVTFNKADKRIDAEFENGHKYHGTIRNGDLLTLSSTDYDTIVSRKMQEVVNTKTEDFLLLEKVNKINVQVYNPAFNKAASEAEIQNCEVQFISSNPNVSIEPNKMVIDFTSDELKDKLKIDVELTATIISINQTAWSPNILNGHYYLNNEEFYLYNETDIKGNFCKEIAPLEKEFFASVIANIETKGNELPIVKYLNGKTSFISGQFAGTVYEDNELKLAYTLFNEQKIYNDYGEYTTEEIILGNELDNIAVSFDGVYLENVKCLISINDGNDWSGFREVGNGLKVTYDSYIKKVKIKFIIERLIDQIADYSESVKTSLKSDFIKYGYEATNLIISDGVITQQDTNKPASYISPVQEVVHGSSHLNVQAESLSALNGLCDIYIAFGNSSTFEPSWTKITEKISVSGKYYYRYKIVFKAGARIAINAVTTTTYYTNTSQVSVTPKVYDVKTSSIPSEWRFAGTIKKPLLCKIKSDTEWRYVTKYNILDIIYPDIALAGISNPRIQDVIIDTSDNDVEIKYDYKNDGRLMARTKTVITEERDSKYLDVNDSHSVEVSPIPKLGAPVILMYEGISLTPITQYDINGDITTEIYEKVIVQNGVIKLSYNNIDEDTLSVLLNDNFVHISKVINNKVILKNIEDGEVEVYYKVKYSYAIDMNHDLVHDKALIKVHLDTKLDKAEYKKISIYYETSDNGTQRLYDIELNPLYSPAHTGFVFLTDKKPTAAKIHISMDKTEYKSIVAEDVYFIIKVTDELGNAVSDVPVRLTTLYGRVKITNNITNKYGIVVAKYSHPSYPCKDVISARVSSTDIITEKEIIISGNNKTMTLSSYVEDSKYIVTNGESITVVGILFEEDLTPLNNKEIVVEVINESGVVNRQNALTNLNGECKFNVVPMIAATDKCEIKVSYLNIENTIFIKVV